MTRIKMRRGRPLLKSIKPLALIIAGVLLLIWMPVAIAAEIPPSDSRDKPAPVSVAAEIPSNASRDSYAFAAIAADIPSSDSRDKPVPVSVAAEIPPSDSRDIPVPEIIADDIAISALCDIPAPVSVAAEIPSNASRDIPAPAADVFDERVIICVLDSGCNIIGAEGWNFLDDSPDITDHVGHGTRLCALVSECAPDARVIMLKCFDAESSFDGSAVAAALYAATDFYGADIISMSWTLNEYSDELRAAIVYASESGAALVASAGNLSLETGLGATVYPAAWDEVIGVAGVNIDARGEPVPSLWYLGGDAVFVCARADYAGEKGSSYAAARVAGALATKLKDNSAARDPREILLESARDIGRQGYDLQFGWGYISTEN